MDTSSLHRLKLAAHSGTTLPELVRRFSMTPMTIVNMCFNQNGDHFDIPERLLDKRLRNGKAVLGEDCIERYCHSCNEHFPFTTEFWGRKNSTADGAQPLCRACTFERDHLRRRGEKHIEVRKLTYLA